MSLRPRRALAGLVLAGAALAALPASALAAITPKLALDQSAGTTAGSTPAIGFHATFSGDPVTDLSLGLPPGLLADANINGGACLASASPSSSCLLGSGTITAGGTPTTPITLYLVAPPKAGDLAGLALVLGTSPAAPASTADIALGATGMDIAFSSMPKPAISDMSFRLTNLRMPTSCPSPAANVTLTANYLEPTSQSTTAPLTVTGCSALPYAPTLSASITKDATDSGAVLVIAIAQAANESASQSIVVNTANGLSPNLGALLACLSGTPCAIGTATAVSPLVPNADLAIGTVTLGGSTGAPTLAITFPAPLAITLTGQVNLLSRTLTFAGMPDLPLTDLTLNITGSGGQPAFTTSCLPANVGGTFTAQSGATHTTSAPITFSHCPGPPTVGRSVHGLADGHPNLIFTVTRGKGAPGVAAVAIGVPPGLRFARSAFVSDTKCTTKGKKLCTTTTKISGLGVTGAKAKTVALRRGKLLITVSKPASRVTITVSGPLLTEGKALQTKVKKHKAKRLTFTLKVTDAKDTATTVPVTVRPG